MGVVVLFSSYDVRILLSCSVVVVFVILFMGACCVGVMVLVLLVGGRE